MASLMSVKMEYDDRELKANLGRFPRKFHQQIDIIFDYNAFYATAWMKTNAPWHDDTGAARASLLAVANNQGKNHELNLSHGVHYGIWLEVAHNRKYQILASAQRHMGAKLMSDMRTAFRRATR